MNNETIEKFTRDELKKGLKLLPHDWVMKFKRMYCPEGSGEDTDIMVDSLNCNELEKALTQVELSIDMSKDK